MSANFQIKEVDGRNSSQQSWYCSWCLRDYVLLVHVIRSFLPEKCMKDEMNQLYELYSVAKTSLGKIFMY